MERERERKIKIWGQEVSFFFFFFSRNEMFRILLILEVKIFKNFEIFLIGRQNFDVGAEN